MAPMSKRNPTYYEILGIPSNAKHNDVGLAFNRKMRAIKREDAPPDLKAETVLKEAFETLSDLDRREQYDAKLRAAVLKPRFGRTEAATAVLFLLVAGVGLFWYLRPQLAPESVAMDVVAPGKSYQEVLNNAIPAVGRLQSVEMSGQSQNAGLAFTVEEGVAVTSCQGLSPTAQLKVSIPPRVIPARVTLTDEELGLCKLEVLGAGTWPLSVSQVPAKPGDVVYTTQLTSKDEVLLQKTSVKAVRAEGKATVLQVAEPLSAQHAGSPLLDMYGRVVAVANMLPGGKETFVAIPPAWGETVKLAPEPKPYQGGDAPAEGSGEGAAAAGKGAVDDLGIPLETRRKQEELASKIDPERRKRLEKAYAPPRVIPE
jgi:hypothetical protein